MGLTCAVCRHPQCKEIEAAVIIDGKSVNSTAQAYGVHRNQLRRHLRNHVGFGLSTAECEPLSEWEPPAATTRPKRREPTIDKEDRLEKRVERILELSEERGNADMMIKASRELRANFELGAKLSGEARAAEVAPPPERLVIAIRQFGPPGEPERPPKMMYAGNPNEEGRYLTEEEIEEHTARTAVEAEQAPLLLAPGDECN